MACDVLKYRSISFSVYHVDARTVWITSPAFDGVREVAPFVAAVLGRCRERRSIEEHAEAIACAVSNVSPAEVLALLASLRDAGMLRDDSSDWPLETRTVRAGARITTIGICTADRPRILSRCLTSYAASSAAAGNSLRWVIVDGSLNRRTAAANRTVAARVASQFDLHLHYIGPTEREWIVGDLTNHGIEEDVLRDCLVPKCHQFGAGACRNMLLLASAGEMVLMVDDDTLCTVWQSSHDDSLVISGHADPRVTHFFSLRSDALQFIDSTSDVDLPTAHMTLLGSSLEGLCRGTDTWHLRSPCEHVVAALDGGGRAQGTVRATFGGIAGDSASSSPSWVLFANGPTRSRLLSNPDTLRTALRSREVVRAALCNTVVHEPNCMAYCMGLDNTRLTPPFLPAGRNEDGVFGGLLSLLDPNALFGHLSCGVVHDSNRPAEYHRDGTWGTRVTLADLVLAAARLSRPPVWVRSDSDRLNYCAGSLSALSRQDLSSFVEAMTSVVLEKASGELRLLDALINDCRGSALAAEAQAYVDATLAAARAAHLLVPLECQPCESVDQAFRAAQAGVSTFAGALRVWPDIWTVAMTRRDAYSAHIAVRRQ